MHVFFAHNTITIFLIEITTNKCFISYNNPLNYSLKYGIKRSIEFQMEIYGALEKSDESMAQACRRQGSRSAQHGFIWGI
jgi:hypothetical protein